MEPILREYSIKKILGKGTFSIVKLGIDRLSGKKVAIKILDKKKILTKDDAERIKREINILNSIAHVNLIKIIKIKEDNENYYMIMEYCEIGELFNYIVRKKKLDENESSYYYFQLINGLEYIHSKNIAHRDLKPENLLIYNKNILKIIDFGLSNYNKSDDLLSTPCGSPCYASPEMIEGKKYDGNLVDIWSTGIILFVMLCGFLPFEGATNKILFQNIINCKVPYPNFLSKMAVDLLKKILVPNPEQRITLSEIKNHPFYLKGKEVFKKINPFIFEKLEKNKLKNIETKYNKFQNFAYGNIVNKTETNDKYVRRLNIRSMNLENILLKLNDNRNKREIISTLNNTPEKNNNLNFKKLNLLNETKVENNKKNFPKPKRDLNYFEKYFFKNNDRTLTEFGDNNLNNNENSNIEKYRFKKIRPKLLNFQNIKENHKSLNEKYYYERENNTPNKIRNYFHSLDIKHSNLLFNYSKKDNKKERHLDDIIQGNQNFLNYQKNKNEKNNQEKNFFYRKIKSIKENQTNKININTINNSKISEKYNSEEKYFKDNKFLKRKIINFYDFNSINKSKNNNTINTFDNNNYKVRHISFNSPITTNFLEELNLKKTKKEPMISQYDNTRFSKYFKLHNEKNNKKFPNNHSIKQNYIDKNLSYYLRKYRLHDAINSYSNKENDKNSANYYHPSITINNMNYNLNIFEPRIFLSTLYSEHKRNNNDFFYKNIENLGISNIKNNNYKNRELDYLINQNVLTEMKPNLDVSKGKNCGEKSFHISNNKNLDKIKSFMKINKKKLFDISKNKENNDLKFFLKHKYIENQKNNVSNSKEKLEPKAKNKKLKAIRKSEFEKDLLYILRKKNSDKNKLKKEYINLNKKRNNILSSSQEKNNISFPYKLSLNKTKLKNFMNIKKKNKTKKINKNTKKNNVLDTLIKDFLNFTTISSKENNIYKI